MTHPATIQLHHAAFDGRCSRVRQLIAEGADPNAPDEQGRTALHWSVVMPKRSKRRAGVVGVLLRRGGNPFQPDRAGRTAEDWARVRGNRGALGWIHRACSIEVARHAGGFTLLETIAAIGAAAALSASTLGFYVHARDVENLAATQATMTGIVAAAEHAYAASADYGNLTTNSALTEGWLPTDGRTPSGPVNGWGNPIALGHTDGARPYGALTLTQDVPSGACAQLVARLARSFNRVIVAGLSVAADSPPATVAACNNGDVVSVEFDRWK